MSLRPKGTPRHNTNPSQIWSSWGKDAATLVDALGALWDDQQRPSQHPVVKATRLVLLDTAATIVNGLAEAKIQAYAQNNAVLDQGYLHFPGVKQTLSMHGLISVLSAAAPWNELVEGHATSHGRPAAGNAPAIKSSKNQVLSALKECKLI